MLEPVSNKVSFPAQEEEILRWWEQHEVFKRSVEQRRNCKPYVFYDGPPFATGLPHYGHLLASTIKDIVPRYQTMRGHLVERRFGWDCHGLPIEALAQEALGLSGAGDIVRAGIDVFNEKCRSMVLTYVDEWRRTISRLGRWVDFDRDYKTMDPSYMETIWWIFKQLWDQGRIYRAHRIMPYSWKLNTPLSNFEAGNNYQDVQDPAITVRLRLTECGGRLDLSTPCYALIWTTTPWTLPANLAACVGPDIEYCAVRDVASGVVYVLAESRLPVYYKEASQFERVAVLRGSELAGWRYEPLFPYFAGREKAFRILTDAFVTTQDGTGIVHMAPAFGEDDYRVCKAAAIALVDPLDADARFTEVVPEFKGVFCKDADKDIIRALKRAGSLVHQTTIVHSYPFCERTDTPLIYRAIDAWYVRVEDLRERLVAANDTIAWMPDFVGEKRFGNWLREAKDWNISRNRFWGSCIPVWIAEDGSDMICVGSRAELEGLAGVKVDDLHKHKIDGITFRRNGKLYRRTPEVLDCWFESGSMPYAQQHFPFEGPTKVGEFFPADFIAEGLDQTRGWFYTLLVLSTALFDRAAYRNVVVNGLILAQDGRKMSKRLKNYPDPAHIINTYGADALRLYMIHSPVVRAEDLCFSEEGVQHALRHLLIPLWNAYSFFVTYARIDRWSPSGAVAASPHLLDRWILSCLARLTAEVTEALDVYDLQRAVRPFVLFIENLTNWYIRRSRRRFWKSSDDADKACAYETLYAVLLRLCKIAAPFLPFMSEAIYRNLRKSEAPESVHLCDFPDADAAARDAALERRMDFVMSAVGLARVLRTDRNLKVRQPLRGIHVVCRDAVLLAELKELADVIADELNVREVWFDRHETALVALTAKANFRALGPRFGAHVKEAAQQIAALSPEALEVLLEGGTERIVVQGAPHDVTSSDVLVERKPHEGLVVASEGNIVVALDVTLTPDLIREGLAREFVNKVQNMRKTADLDVAARISVSFVADEEVRAAVEAHRAYIQGETLCVALDCDADTGEGSLEWDVNGHACHIRIERSVV